MDSLPVLLYTEKVTPTLSPTKDRGIWKDMDNVPDDGNRPGFQISQFTSFLFVGNTAHDVQSALAG